MTDVDNACKEAREDLAGDTETYKDSRKNSLVDGSIKMEVQETKARREIDVTKEITKAGIDAWINSEPDDPEASLATSAVISGKRLEARDGLQKRQRRTRSRRRRGFGQRDNWNFPSQDFTPRKRMGYRGGRGGFRRQGARNVADVTRLPDGILLVEDDDYVGYHCIYCNCILASLATVKGHVDGLRHRVTLEARNIERNDKEEILPHSEAENNSEQTAKEGNNIEDDAEQPEKKSSNADKDTEVKENEDNKGDMDAEVKENKDNKGDMDAEAKENKDNEGDMDAEEKENKDNQDDMGRVESGEGKRDMTSPLKSTLDDFLAEVTDPVIGLDYITEKQKQGGEVSFNCSLCKVDLPSDDMKIHIAAARHRLMYMKMKDPQKITELMTKNLQKAERNKEIREYTELLMNKHGRGTIVVEHSEEKGKDVGEKKRSSGARRRNRRKTRRGQLRKEEAQKEQVHKEQAHKEQARQVAPKQKSNQVSSSKSRRGRFFGATQRKRSNNGPYPPGKKQPHETPHPWIQPFAPDQLSRGGITNNTSFPWEQSVCSDQMPKANVVGNVYNTDSSLHDQQYVDYSSSSDFVQREKINKRMECTSDYSRVPSSSSQRNFMKSKKGNKTNPLKLLGPSIDVTNEEEAGIVMNVINSLTERFLHYKLKNTKGPAREILEKNLKGETLQKALNCLPDDDDIVRAVKNSVPKRDLDKPLHSWNDIGNIAYSRDKVDQPRHDWDEDRDITYSRDRISKSRADFNEDIGIAYPRDRINKHRHDPDEIRDTVHARDGMRKNENDFDEYYKDRMGQPRRDSDEYRNIVYSRDRINKSQDDFPERMSQSHHGWNENRDNVHNIEMMNKTQDEFAERGRKTQSQYDWNDTKDTAYSRDTMDWPQQRWSESRDIASAKSMMDQPKCNWIESMDFTSTRNLMDKSQHNWRSENKPITKGIRNTDSLNQSFSGWNKSKQMGSFRNTIPESFSQSQYSSNSNTTFTKSESNWSEKNSPQLRSNTKSYASQMQSGTDSLSLSKNHPSYVDDLFDRYQMKVKLEKNNGGFTNMSSENRSQFNSSYVSPPTSSNFNRPNTFGHLSTTGSSANWKY